MRDSERLYWRNVREAAEDGDIKAKAIMEARAAARLRQDSDNRPPTSNLMDPTASFKEHIRKEQIGKPPDTDAERVIYDERMRDLAEVDAKEGTSGHAAAARAFDQKWIQPERDARKAARQAAENPEREAPIPSRAAPTAEQVWGVDTADVPTPAHHEGAPAATVIEALPPSKIYSDAEMLAASIPMSQQNAEVPSIQTATTPATPSTMATRTIRPAPPVRDQVLGVGRGRTIVAPPARTTAAKPRPAAANAPHVRSAPPGQRVTNPHPAMRTTAIRPTQASGRTDRNAPDVAQGRAQPIRPAGMASRPRATSPLCDAMDAGRAASKQQPQQQTRAHTVSR
ncbi:hypothetical protein HLH33_00640 [Gluconacetobacter diazotrophicus]|uniref:Uncharacterized protein n=1 Tax=Gluconacetobacter diazotrophicus TaxID=33996 RepID=A0A7W4FBY9_GLUDI|nr:hypothetical protein [Gluconacetobacter diazotrophicus]MBB2154827.1 hypothetical protein [Gluconacetobacter diazotrophicus]